MHTERKTNAVFVQFHNNTKPRHFCGFGAVTTVVVNNPYHIIFDSHKQRKSAQKLTIYGIKPSKYYHAQ